MVSFQLAILSREYTPFEEGICLALQPFLIFATFAIVSSVKKIISAVTPLYQEGWIRLRWSKSRHPELVEGRGVYPHAAGMIVWL